MINSRKNKTCPKLSVSIQWFIEKASIIAKDVANIVKLLAFYLWLFYNYSYEY
jgi:hypothetical protein